MSFLTNLKSALPFAKKEEVLEYFFALNIANESLTAALWVIEGKELKILETASKDYSSLDDLSSATDKLLDDVLGDREIEPQKILFGVPSFWLQDENIKDEYLKTLRKLVKELELTPMAYVETAHALTHFLEKQEGVPPTAILVGFEEHHLIVTVVRAGKIDGVKVVTRGDNSGADIEKVLLTFTQVETLPSKIFIYGAQTDLKSQLLSFAWMSKLSFLHFPKIDSLQDEIVIKSICLAGATEVEGNISYTESPLKQVTKQRTALSVRSESEDREERADKDKEADEEQSAKLLPQEKVNESDKDADNNLGFVVGDVSTEPEDGKVSEAQLTDGNMLTTEEEFAISPESNLAEIEDFEHELPAPTPKEIEKISYKSLIAEVFRSIPKPKHFKSPKYLGIFAMVLAIPLLIFLAYLFVLKAEVKVFVEPRVLENEAQVTADPNQKSVDEQAKIIPGQIVNVEVSGSGKSQATGTKQVGDPAKGTVKIINNSLDAQSFSKGAAISANNMKFTLDSTVNIASTSAIATSKSTATVTVTATSVGADGNLPTGSQFTGLSSQVAVVAEGNFSGGNSKDVKVVSGDDQQKLLASVASGLRKQAQQKLQDQLPQKKILTESLNEEIVKKSFSKNINDQSSEFSLNLTARYKGTAFDDQDLRSIVSTLVTTRVPDGFQLDLSNTETQADVSKLDKSGKLIFLARFKAKLLPKIDANEVASVIKGKTINQALDTIKGMENVLGAEIKISPSLPKLLQRLPLLAKKIHVEVGLK